MIPITIKLIHSTTANRYDSVFAIPRPGDVIVYNKQRYDVIEVEHHLDPSSEIIVNIAPRVVGQKVWK